MEPSESCNSGTTVAAYEEVRQTTTRVANRPLQTSSVAYRESLGVNVLFRRLKFGH